MVRACHEAGVQAVRRQAEPPQRTLQLLKQAIDAGPLRPHLHGQRQRVLDAAAELLRRRALARPWDIDGGAFMNQASHYVDLLDWLVGPVDSVHAYTATLARDIEVEDTGVMSLRLAQRRAWARSTSPCSRYPKNFEGTITILGEQRHGARRRRGRQPDRALGVRRRRTRGRRRSTTPATRPPRSTASATRCTTTTSSTRCAARRSRDRRPRGPALAGGADRHLPSGARRHARQPAAGVLSDGRRRSTPPPSSTTARSSATARRVWHFAHVCAGARIGEGCSLGQSVYVGNDVRIGDNVKIQNNVSVYDAVTLEDDVFCGPSMVFTNVYNPRSAVPRKDEYRRTLVQARRHAGRQLHHRLRHHGRRARLRRRRRGGQPRRAGLRAGGRRAGAPHRLDEPPRRAPGPAGCSGDGEAACPATGERYRLRRRCA